LHDVFTVIAVVFLHFTR